MAVGNVVGRAYIEIHADSKPFAKELGVEIEAIAKAAETRTRTQRAGATVARNIAQGARRTLRREARNIFSGLLDDLSGRNGGAFRRLGMNLGRNVGSAIGVGVSSALKGGFSLLNQLGSSLGNVGGKGGLGFGVIIAIGALVAGVVVLVQQLAGLVNALLLIPGALGAVLFSIIPVVVAFHGFGDAISAILEGDPDKINEALKKLTPSARSVAKEFQKLLPLLHDLHTVAQESFFKGIKGDLSALGTALGPTFKAGFGEVATSAGKFVDGLLKLFSSPEGQKFFKTMFDLATTLLDVIGPAINGLVQGLMSIAGGSADQLSTIFANIALGISEFGLWLDRITKDGRLQDFFNSMSRAFDALMLVAGVTWTLASALFGSNPEDLERNRVVLDLLAGVIKQLADFLKSDLGKHGLTSMFILLVAIAAVFSLILQVILAIGGALEWAGEKLGAFYAFLTGKPQPPKAVWLPGGPPAPPANNSNVHGKGHASGAIVTRPEVAALGEQGPEVVIPLTNPRRAQQLVHQSGLMDMMGGNDTHVNVYIGNEQIDARVEKVAAGTIRTLTRGMKYGPRPVGVGG